ncbi:hypothetical protein [Sulfurimonas sp.]|uniref:hypothetical protein n=1 Tax=Sulfurimonas sp. TaxID=2022749 RepID=UPI003D10BDED
MVKFLTLLVLLSLIELSGFEVKFPDKPGHAEKRITIKGKDGWAVCTAKISGHTQNKFAKLKGRKDNEGREYTFKDNQKQDVRAGDYYFMAGGSVCCSDKIIAKLSCHPSK